MAGFNAVGIGGVNPAIISQVLRITVPTISGVSSDLGAFNT